MFQLIKRANYPASGQAGVGVSVGTNGVSVYEHALGYMPATLVWVSPTPLTDWTHVAVVYNDRRPYLYINGVLVKTGLQSQKQHIFPGTQFPGGSYGVAGGGQVDEFRIWKGVRSQQQIADNMHGEVSPADPDLSGYWPMNEGSGVVLHDISTNGRDIGLNDDYNSNWVLGSKSIENKSSYRYAFNGKEKDTDIGEDSYTAEFWEYDSRIGRRWNVDPRPVVGVSYYSAFNNNPISLSDVLGDSSVFDKMGMIVHYDKKDVDKRVFMQSDDKTLTYIGELGGKLNVKEIIANITFRNRIEAMLIGQIPSVQARTEAWVALVLPYSQWDYKNRTGTIFGVAWAYDVAQGTKTEDHTKFVGDKEFPDAAAFGNYNAGFTGVYANVPRDVQRTFAGLGEVVKKENPNKRERLKQIATHTPPMGDQPKDYKDNTDGMDAADAEIDKMPWIIRHMVRHL